MTGPSGHPTPEQIDLVVRGEASQPVSNAVVRHLLSGCPQCQMRAAAVWYRTEPAIVQLVLAPEKIRKRIPKKVAVKQS